MRKVLASLPKDCPVVLVNVRADEVRAYKRAHKNTIATEAVCLSEALSQFIPGGYVVIEDIINLAKREERTLRKLLNFDAHHNKIRVVCVAHLLYRTSLLSLVSLFNFVAFTLSNAGRALVKQAAMFGFYLEPAKSKEWVQAFSAACKKWGEHGGCVYIACKEVKIYHRSVNNESTQLEKTESEDILPRATATKKIGGEKKTSVLLKSRVSEDHAELLERFSRYFRGHAQSATAISIFSIVASVIADEPSFRPFDMTFSFKQQRRPNSVKRVSLVDYIDCLVDARPLAAASRDFKVLHRYLAERCKIPLLFILNPHFRLRAVFEESSDAEEDDDDDDDDDDDSEEVESEENDGDSVERDRSVVGNVG